MKQFGLQLCLELRHLPAYSRERFFLLARRCRQAAGFGNRQHNGHGLQTIHGYFHILEGSISILPDIQHFRKGLFRGVSNRLEPEPKEPVMVATKNTSTGLGAVQADRLPKRAYDFIPVAILVTALFALLALSVWFAAYAWTHLGGDPVPTYGYVALAGGVVISLAVGGGLMALVFYSSRHGYDDLSGGGN